MEMHNRKPTQSLDGWVKDSLSCLLHFTEGLWWLLIHSTTRKSRSTCLIWVLDAISRLWLPTTTPSNTLPQCTRSIIAKCTRPALVSPAIRFSRTERPTEPLGIIWPVACRISTTSGMELWNWRWKSDAASTQKAKHCPNTGKITNKLCSSIWAKLTAEFVARCLTPKTIPCQTPASESKVAVSGRKLLPWASSGVFSCRESTFFRCVINHSIQISKLPFVGQNFPPKKQSCVLLLT